MNDRIHQIKAMLESDPDDSFLRFALAKELEKNGIIDRSLAEYKDLIRLDPAYIGTYYHYAQLLIQTGSSEIAHQTINKGVSIAQGAGDHHAAGELKGLLAAFEEE